MGDYHSSDGPRNMERKKNLIRIKAQSNSNLLNLPSKSNKIDFENNANNLKAIKELEPLNSSPNSGNTSKINSIAVRGSESPKKNKAKMKGYVFLRKTKVKNLEGTIEQEDINKSQESNENRDDHDDSIKLTEKNNMLIEQMMMDRKRQYSLATELNGPFKSRLAEINKAKPHKRVLKKFINKKTTKKFSNSNNIIEGSGSKINSPIARKSNETPDLKLSKKLLIKESEVGSNTHKNSPKNSSTRNVLKYRIKGSKHRGLATYKNKMKSMPIHEDHKFKNNQKLESKINLSQHKKTDNNLDVPKNDSQIFGSSEASNSRNLSPSRMTTEQIITQSIAELDKINEENSVSQVSESFTDDPSPKVLVGITDTWGSTGSVLDETWNDLMQDIDFLELKYRLRENWLDTKTTLEKPFVTQISAIFTWEDSSDKE